MPDSHDDMQALFHRDTSLLDAGLVLQRHIPARCRSDSAALSMNLVSAKKSINSAGGQSLNVSLFCWR